MFKALSRLLDHSRRLKVLEDTLATLQDGQIDLAREQQRLEDHCARSFGRLFKRIEREDKEVPVEDKNQLSLDQRPTAQQYFSRRR